MNEQLDAIATLMAAAVRPCLARATRAGYARYLSAMVDYTRESGVRLEHAAARSSTPELRGFFSRLAHEEGGHWQLARADLEALGEPATLERHPDVDAFHARWMATQEPARWLGALRVLESVGGHLLLDAPVALARLQLGPTTTRFVRVHLEVDAEHGARTAEMCAAVTDEATLIASALDAASFWVNLHLAALRER